MTIDSKPNRDEIKEDRRTRKEARTQAEKNVSKWSDLTTIAGGEPGEHFTPSRTAETDTKASLMEKATIFIQKIIEPFGDVNTKATRITPEPADASLIRAYTMVETFLGISKWQAGSPPVFEPGNRSLLVNVHTGEQAQAISKAYAGDIYWRTIGLPREVKERMLDDGTWVEGRYPESDISSLVLPFWNGVDAWMDTDGGLPIAPYEKSTMINGWRFFTTATEVDDSEVWLTSYLFGPQPKPRQSLTAIPREPNWRPQLVAVRHSNFETATYESYYVDGLRALSSLMKLEDREAPSTYALNAEERRKLGAEAAWMAATGDLSLLDGRPSTDTETMDKALQAQHEHWVATDPEYPGPQGPEVP